MALRKNPKIPNDRTNELNEFQMRSPIVIGLERYCCMSSSAPSPPSCMLTSVTNFVVVVDVVVPGDDELRRRGVVSPAMKPDAERVIVDDEGVVEGDESEGDDSSAAMLDCSINSFSVLAWLCCLEGEKKCDIQFLVLVERMCFWLIECFNIIPSVFVGWLPFTEVMNNMFSKDLR